MNGGGTAEVHNERGVDGVRSILSKATTTSDIDSGVDNVTCAPGIRGKSKISDDTDMSKREMESSHRPSK